LQDYGNQRDADMARAAGVKLPGPKLASCPNEVFTVAPPLLAVRHRQECLGHRQILCGTGHQRSKCWGPREREERSRGKINNFSIKIKSGTKKQKRILFSTFKAGMKLETKVRRFGLIRASE